MSKFIFHMGKDLEYRKIISSLARMDEDAETEFTIIDLSKLLHYKGNSTILYPFRHTLISLPNVKSLFPSRFSYDKNISVRPLTENIHNCIMSSLITILRDDCPNLESRRVYKLYEKLIEDYFSVFNFLSYYFNSLDKNIHEIYVPNGRFPGQKVLVDFFYEQKIFYYERGMKENTYYCRSYPTQDRNSIQLDFLHTNYQSIDLNFVKSLESKVDLKVPDSFTHSFRELNFKAKLPTICIFTSSIDEFAHLGRQWNRNDDLGQWEAIELIIPILSKFYTVIIRQHPNMVNKSRINYLREIEIMKNLQRNFSDLIIFDSNSSINSYTLAKNSKAVIVWNSTIGLEASALGIRVYHLAPTYYDKIADVRYIDDFEKINNLLNLDWKVDSTKALRYFSYLLNSNYPILFQMSGFSFYWYKLLKFLSYFFYDGGAINPFFKFRSVKDSFRNRTFKNNFRKLLYFLFK